MDGWAVVDAVGLDIAVSIGLGDAVLVVPAHPMRTSARALRA
jgi:hypothetical protein